MQGDSSREISGALLYNFASVAPLGSGHIKILFRESIYGTGRVKDQQFILSKHEKRMDEIRPLVRSAMWRVLDGLHIQYDEHVGYYTTIIDYRAMLAEVRHAPNIQSDERGPDGRLIVSDRLIEEWQSRGLFPRLHRGLIIGESLDLAIASAITLIVDQQVNGSVVLSGSIPDPHARKWWAYAQHFRNSTIFQYSAPQLDPGLAPDTLLWTPWETYSSKWHRKNGGALRFAGIPSWEQLSMWTGKSFQHYDVKPSASRIRTELNYLAIERLISLHAS